MFHWEKDLVYSWIEPAPDKDLKEVLSVCFLIEEWVHYDISSYLGPERVGIIYK